MTLDIYQQGDRLRAGPQGQLSTRLLYQGGGVFWAEHDPSLHFSFVAADGQVQSLTIEQGGRAMPPAKRIR